MSTAVQRRRGTTAQHASFAGLEGELTVDTTKDTLVIHDGSTAGGRPLLREDQANLPSSVTNGLYTPGTNSVALSTSGAGRVFIDASGNVGVGVSSPVFDFDVYASGQTVCGVRSGGTNASILLQTSSTGYGTGNGFYLGTSSGSNYIWSYENEPIVFGSNNTERLRITSAGLVGIGTSTVSRTLDVVGTGIYTAFTGNTGATFNIIPEANGQDGVLLAASYQTGTGYGPIKFGINGEKMRLDASGRLGIGTTSPTRLLQVAAGASSANGILVTGSNSPSYRLEETAGSVAGQFGIDSSACYFGTSTNHPQVFNTNSTERARIDTSGRLLVGTSSTRGVGISDVLKIQHEADYGGISVVTNRNDGDSSYVCLGKSRGTTAGSNAILQSGDTIGRIVFAGADGTDMQCRAAEIAVWVDGTPGVDDMPGRLVFSTTADGASSPTERMRIGNSGISYFYSSGASVQYIASSSAAGTTNNILQGGYDATNVTTFSTSFLVHTNGDVKNTNNAYGALSDIKLKENIVDASSQWDDIKALRPVNYNFKEGQTHTQIGLIAQEVELVSPGLVSESPDRDAEGNDLGTTTKSVNYSVLYMKAVKALQEAMERIEQLEAEMVAVKAQLS